MTFTSLLGLILLSLFGAAIVVGALNAKKLIAWENRALVSLADAIQNYRESLEEEQRILEANYAPPAPVHVHVAHGHVQHGSSGRRAA